MTEIKKSNEGQGDDEENNYAVVPPNGGWGWMVVACAFYCCVVTDGIQLTYGIFLEDISQSFHVDYSRVALAGSLMFGVHLLVGPLCAAFSTEFGLRPVTITGSIICCIGIGLSYFATSYWYLYFTYGIMAGLGLGLIYMNCLLITGLYFTTLMPIAVGIVVCGTGVGTMVFAGLGYFLLSKTDWQTSFLIQSAFAGSMGLAAIAFRPLKPIKVKLTSNLPGVSSAKLPSAGSKPSTSKISFKRGILFVKKQVPADVPNANLATYQNLAWDSYLEDTFVTDFRRTTSCKLKCACRCRCCKTRKPTAKQSEVVILSEVKSDPLQRNRRKSYVGRQVTINEDKSEYELGQVFPRDSSANQILFEEVIYEKKERPFCVSLKRTIASMVNCRLLGSCAFLIFTLSGAVQLASLLIVYIYEKERCKSQLGFTDEMSVYFVICLGGANTFWRLCLGGIALIPNVNYEALTVSGIVIGGLATIFSGFYNNLYYQFGFCVLFGLGMATFAVFRLILLLDLVETPMVENATGINLLFMGITCITFPPLFGWLMELTKNYNVIFITTGILICLSGLMLIGLKKLSIKERKKAAQNAIVK